jgi:hypothetical protein
MIQRLTLVQNALSGQEHCFITGAWTIWGGGVQSLLSAKVAFWMRRQGRAGSGLGLGGADSTR